MKPGGRTGPRGKGSSLPPHYQGTGKLRGQKETLSGSHRILICPSAVEQGVRTNTIPVHMELTWSRATTVSSNADGHMK